MFMNKTTTQVFDLDRVRRVAPSVFAEMPHDGVSDRYGFINTAQVIDAMLKEGFVITNAKQQLVRDEGRKAFTKHMLRFRHRDEKPLLNKGDVFSEIVMFNSHDRSSGFQMDAGLFRLACSNGLVVPAGGDFGNFRCRHSKGSVDSVIEGVYSVIENVPEIAAQIENMNAINLTRPEQEAFARSALMLRWDEGAAPITEAQVLSPRRSVDRETDVFTTMNVVQENLIRGGIRGIDTTGRRRFTRAVDSINADTKLNKALYSLAAEMAKIKKAA